MNKIGFIGIGIMGKSMARNLMKKGFIVTVYARDRKKAEDIIAEGASFAESIGECAKGQDVVITIVGYPKDVEEVYFGRTGILENADPGTILIDMTTNSPKLAVRIYEAAREKGLQALDAPVTGGDSGARMGTLTILAGGDQAAYEASLPLFEAMGQNLNYMGAAGSGQHTKMANQIAIAGALAGVCEAMSYAKAQGLDQSAVIEAIRTGAAGSSQMNVYAPRILAGDMAPGFFIKHFVKDMAIACEEAKEDGADLKVLDCVLSIFREMESDGKGELGTQALIQYYDNQR